MKDDFSLPKHLSELNINLKNVKPYKNNYLCNMPPKKDITVVEKEICVRTVETYEPLNPMTFNLYLEHLLHRMDTELK